MTNLAGSPVARVLPHAEWPRLSRTAFGDLWQTLDPALSDIVVVEVAGSIVAHWATMTMVHVEGLGVMEAFRGRKDVAAALVTEMARVLAEQGIGEVLTQATDPKIEQLIQAAGGSQVPGSSWVLPVATLAASVQEHA